MITQSPRQGHPVEKARAIPSTSKDENVTAGKAPDPCRLVSVSEAETFTGGGIVNRVEAPLGPTCIYARGVSQTDITLALEATTVTSATRGMRKAQKVLIYGRTAYCGTLGSQVLFVPLPDGTVLHVTGPCAVAKRFAVTALRRLTA